MSVCVCVCVHVRVRGFVRPTVPPAIGEQTGLEFVSVPVVKRTPAGGCAGRQNATGEKKMKKDNDITSRVESPFFSKNPGRISYNARRHGSPSVRRNFSIQHHDDNTERTNIASSKHSGTIFS